MMTVTPVSVTLGDEAEPYGDRGANFSWLESDNEVYTVSEMQM